MTIKVVLNSNEEIWSTWPKKLFCFFLDFFFSKFRPRGYHRVTQISLFDSSEEQIHSDGLMVAIMSRINTNSWWSPGLSSSHQSKQNITLKNYGDTADSGLIRLIPSQEQYGPGQNYAMVKHSNSGTFIFILSRPTIYSETLKADASLIPPDYEYLTLHCRQCALVSHCSSISVISLQARRGELVQQVTTLLYDVSTQPSVTFTSYLYFYACHQHKNNVPSCRMKQ